MGKHGLAKACERWSSRRTYSAVVLAPQQKVLYREEDNGWLMVLRYLFFLLFCLVPAQEDLHPFML